jgi:hypothetical protein
LDAIIGSSQRWQQLELGLISFGLDVLYGVFSLSPDDLCMLRELRIHSLCSITDKGTQEDEWNQSGVFTAQGLRSISIARMSPNAFNAGIPPNWKNLNHLFIHSPIALKFAHSMLSHCCNLVACLLVINVDSTISLSSCILPHLTFLSVQGYNTGFNQLLSSIEAPSLKTLDYHGDFFDLSEKFGLLNFFQNINSLETLRVDDHHLTKSNALKYYTLIPSVTHLVLGQPPKQYSPNSRPAHPRYRHPTPNSYFTTLHEFRHQYSPDSSPTLLFPSLEIFEAYHISGVTDIMLLKFIKDRIDASMNDGGVSKLKKVSVELARQETDIIPEALAYAQAAGIKLELDVTYYTRKGSWASWSPSFGLLPGDVSWQYPTLYDF